MSEYAYAQTGGTGRRGGMSGRFNDPRLMGNCENCYYATDRSIRCSWLESGKFYDCHRYPMTMEKERGGYCGEFAWNAGASLMKEAI